MSDPTEGIRRALVSTINSSVESRDEVSERQRLEEVHGQVWDTKELQKDFEVHAFLAPFIYATHKETGRKGTLMFQHMPRFYFLWQPD